MVKRAKYGDNVAIAKRLGVTPEYVREVRKRIKRGDTNFYSSTSRRICRAILRAEKAGTEAPADIP